MKPDQEHILKKYQDTIKCEAQSNFTLITVTSLRKDLNNLADLYKKLGRKVAVGTLKSYDDNLVELIKFIASQSDSVAEIKSTVYSEIVQNMENMEG